MRKLLLYSHDTFGLGNIRRMVAIGQALLEADPDLAILLITGSPMIHEFRLPERLDYIKLPVLRRMEAETYSCRYLGMALDETIKLRSDLILAAAANFQPDVVLVDKKPHGVQHELTDALAYLKAHHPQTRIGLILRDILDAPTTTIAAWEKGGHTRAIESLYDLVLVLGAQEIFDPCPEYRLPQTVAGKVRFCGYTRRPGGHRDRADIRQELGLEEDAQLVLVTSGGGEDGYQLLETYVAGLRLLPPERRISSLIITGPEMPIAQRAQLVAATATDPRVHVIEFTNDPMSYMGAADAVVAMGGYNTFCEILSLGKSAVIVPRIRPLQEQWIRAERMARLGIVTALYPDTLTPQRLIDALLAELERGKVRACLDLEALPRIAELVENWFREPSREEYLIGAGARHRRAGQATAFVRAWQPAPPRTTKIRAR